MALFGGKKKETPKPAEPTGEMAPPEGMPGNSPVDAVRSMKQQNMTNNEIIQELQKQGYNSQQIFDAINTIEPANMPAGPIETGAPAAPQQGYGEMQPPGAMGGTMPPPQQAAYPPTEDMRGRIEEITEAIIDEKWEELVKSINKIIEWKEKIEGNINKIEQEIKDVKESFGQLNDSIIGKIREYDKNIVNVGTQVKAMEKVFEKVLPTFTENVSELKRIVKNNKK